MSTRAEHLKEAARASGLVRWAQILQAAEATGYPPQALARCGIPSRELVRGLYTTAGVWDAVAVKQRRDWIRSRCNLHPFELEAVRQEAPLRAPQAEAPAVPSFRTLAGP
jgi:hypothetical protein